MKTPQKAFVSDDNSYNSHYKPTLTPNEKKLSSQFNQTFTPSGKNVNSQFKPTFTSNDNNFNSQFKQNFASNDNNFGSKFKQTFNQTDNDFNSQFKPTFNQTDNDFNSQYKPTFNQNGTNANSQLNQTFTSNDNNFSSQFNQTFNTDDLASGSKKMGAPLNSLDLIERPIVDVWNYNFEKEFERLIDLLPQFNYIAMDTEFPGTVVKATGSTLSTEYSKFSYINSAYNVNCTKVIQIGLSLFNVNGRNHPDGSTWQFNMRFDNEEMNAPDSMNLLINAGVDFKKIRKIGINHIDFSEKFLSSGLILNNNITWIVYHGISDFGYLLKMATGSNIPYEYNEFLDILRVYFPYVYDVKHLVNTFEQFRGRLQDLASNYHIRRHGTCHQAGSDAMITGDCFFKIKNRSLRNTVLQSHCGVLAHFSSKGYQDVIKNGFASFEAPIPSHLIKNLNTQPSDN